MLVPSQWQDGLQSYIDLFASPSICTHLCPCLAKLILPFLHPNTWRRKVGSSQYAHNLLDMWMKNCIDHSRWSLIFFQVKGIWISLPKCLFDTVVLVSAKQTSTNLFVRTTIFQTDRLGFHVSKFINHFSWCVCLENYMVSTSDLKFMLILW